MTIRYSIIPISMMLSSCVFTIQNKARLEYLPHRAMHEIDVQGHMDFVASRPCPAVYDAPNGELRFCL